MITGRSSQQGFSLVELAVVMAIVGLLLGGALFTLSAQIEQRNFEETRRRLDQARELLLSYAMVNGRLPCPATATSSGEEAPVGGGTCTTNYAGWLPGRTLGLQNTDGSGYAVDVWGNRIGYAVANLITNCSGTSTTPHFTSAANLKTNGMSCQPSDLLVCKSATGITSTACGGSANQVMVQNLVAAVIYSTGKNGATAGGSGIDEAANLNGDRVFVFHTPSPVGATNGEFDDQVIWVTHGELYGKLVAAGVLP
jgi:prepilin-type N-terminal cleavage/methylation domain-containing protein